MTPTTAPRRRAGPRRKTPGACAACGDGIPEYFAVLTPVLSLCTLCRLLPLSRPGNTSRIPGGEETAQCTTSVSEARVEPLLLSTTEDAKKKLAVALVVAWASAHDNRWPTIRDFGHGKGLPPLETVYRFWGGVISMRAVLALAHPHIYETMAPHWTPLSICAAFRAWIVQHPGRIPLAKDLHSDRTLPGFSPIQQHFRGMGQFYRIFEAGQYAAQFEQYLRTQRRRAGQRTQEVRLDKRAAP